MIRVIRRYHSVQLDEYTNFENNLKGAAARRYALRARCLARRHNLYLKDLVDVMRASDDPDTRADGLKQNVLSDRLCNTTTATLATTSTCACVAQRHFGGFARRDPTEGAEQKIRRSAMVPVGREALKRMEKE